MAITAIFSSVMIGILMVVASLILLPSSGAWFGKRFPVLDRNGPAIATGIGGWFVLMMLLVLTIDADKSAGPTVATTSPAPAPATPGAASSPAPPRQAPSPAPVAIDVSNKVNPDGAFLIEGDGWEKSRRQWGTTWIKRINKAMPKALAKAAQSPECDYAELAGLSDRSEPRKRIVFYVDCRNEKRFYVSEDDILGAAPVVSKQTQTASISDATAIQGCERSVKSQLNYPLTFDRHYLDTSVYRADGGNIVVQFVFDAKNALGAELPQRARCVIDDEGFSPAEITRG
jgi:hypothetical protein